MLKKDDWELTLREMKSQRNQLLLQLEMNAAIIVLAEHRVKQLKKSFKIENTTKTKSERQNF